MKYRVIYRFKDKYPIKQMCAGIYNQLFYGPETGRSAQIYKSAPGQKRCHEHGADRSPAAGVGAGLGPYLTMVLMFTVIQYGIVNTALGIKNGLGWSINILVGLLLIETAWLTWKSFALSKADKGSSKR